MRSTLSFTAAVLLTLGAQAQPTQPAQDHAAHHPGAASAAAPAASAARAKAAKPAPPSAASGASAAMGMEMRPSMNSSKKPGMHDEMHKPGGMHDQMHGSDGPMKSGAAMSAVPAAPAASK